LFLDQGVIEPVVLRSRQPLPSLAPRQRQQAGAVGSCQQTLHAFLVLLREHRAGDIQQFTTRREDLLVGEDGAEDRDSLRKELAGLPDPESADHADGLDSLLGRLRATKSNDELF
jgi:transcription termination factor Rho